MIISDVTLLKLCNIYGSKMSIKTYPADFKQRLTVTDKDSILNKYKSYYTF